MTFPEEGDSLKPSLRDPSLKGPSQTLIRAYGGDRVRGTRTYRSGAAGVLRGQSSLNKARVA